MVMQEFPPTERTRVHRLAKRGVYDRHTVYSILDEAVVCHVSFAVDGRPVTIPTGYGRDGDTLYIHGSPASRMLRTLAGGVEACVTVTLLDGLVLARSAFHHSMNYRSVVIFGKATLVEEPERKLEALRIFTEHVIPGRWARVRPPTAHELKSTTVLEMPLEEVSAKVRSGPPIDDEEDMGIETWAGVIPVRLAPGEPLPDTEIPFGAAPAWTRPVRAPSVI
jgi:nitroimidazol reductase NimA-like FMN-containing flavoprotein (pyridoxamine 5'-phosphate oxidase superfamily)